MFYRQLLVQCSLIIDGDSEKLTKLIKKIGFVQKKKKKRLIENLRASAKETKDLKAIDMTTHTLSTPQSNEIMLLSSVRCFFIYAAAETGAQDVHKTTHSNKLSQ